MSLEGLDPCSPWRIQFIIIANLNTHTVFRGVHSSGRALHGYHCTVARQPIEPNWSPTADAVHGKTRLSRQTRQVGNCISHNSQSVFTVINFHDYRDSRKLIVS